MTGDAKRLGIGQFYGGIESSPEQDSETEKTGEGNQAGTPAQSQDALRMKEKSFLLLRAGTQCW
jgi:hypothetical protein